jgi:addiction module HigA family antidote
MEEFLKPLDLSLRELSRRMSCGPTRISEIVHGKRSITAETSILLGNALGVSPAFFLGLQMDHDLALAALALQKKAA